MYIYIFICYQLYLHRPADGYLLHLYVQLTLPHGPRSYALGYAKGHALEDRTFIE